VLDILKSTIREFLDDDAMRMAAALSYYTVFSLPPLLILILFMSGMFLDPDVVETRVLGQVEDVLGDEGAGQFQTMITEAAELGTGPLAFILSLLALAFGATGAFFQLQIMLNQAWGVAPDPVRSGITTFLLKRLVSFGMILTVAFLLLVSLILGAILTRAGAAIADALPGPVSSAMLYGADIAFSLVVFTVLFGAVFKVLPDARVTWRSVGVGAAVTAVLAASSDCQKSSLPIPIAVTGPKPVRTTSAALDIAMVSRLARPCLLHRGCRRARLAGCWKRPWCPAHCGRPRTLGRFRNRATPASRLPLLRPESLRSPCAR
jgi:membrane protein